MKVIIHDNKRIKIDTLIADQKTQAPNNDVFNSIIGENSLPFQARHRDKVGWYFE